MSIGLHPALRRASIGAPAVCRNASQRSPRKGRRGSLHQRPGIGCPDASTARGSWTARRHRRLATSSSPWQTARTSWRVFDRWRAAKPQHTVHTWFRSDGTVKDVYTLQALYDAAGAVASQLQGVDVAILCYPPGLEFVVAFYGCLFAGAAAAPCYPPDPRKKRGRRATSRASCGRPARP